MIGALTALIFTNFFWRDVIGQYEVVNHTKSTQLNPSITELITITKYHSFEGKLGVSRMDGFLTLEIFEIFVLDVFVFSEIIMATINW